MNDPESFKVEIMYSQRAKFAFSTFTREDSHVSIDKGIIGFIPYNTPFYIIFSAKYKSSKEEQNLSIMFKLEWQSSINLDLAAQDIGVPFGQDLLIDAYDVFLYNIDNQQEQMANNLEWHWLCPSHFNCSTI